MSQARFWCAFTFFHNGRIGRKPFAAGEINRQANQHADSGRAEAPVPAVNFTKRASDEWGDDDTGVNEDVVDLEGVGAAIVARRIERADLTGEVSLEATDTDEKRRQRDEKRDVESYEKLAGRHQ